MNWMDRYLYAVTRRLPKNMREDIERELRSNLMDALDERLDGREPTEQDILDLLDAFGDPEKVAAEYRPENRYLIGPELIDLYWMIIKIVGAVVIFGLTVSLVISILLGEAPQSGPFSVIGGFVGTLWSAAVGLVGTITIIFAVIQHTAAGESLGRSETANELREAGKEITGMFEDMQQSHREKRKAGKPSAGSDKQPAGSAQQPAWSAQQLPEVPVPSDRVILSDSIASLVFIGIALLVFNVYPDKIGVYFYDKAASIWVTIPLFNVLILSVYVMFYNVVWILEALLHLRLIQKGRWGFTERMAKIILSIVGVGIFIALVQNPAVFNTEGITAALAHYSGDFAGIAKLGSLNLKIIVIIVVVATAVEVVKQAYYAIKSKAA
ncbi:HAAS signaling domain-containing protein [Acidaminobacter hydrogenoformans]|uniref:Uncharacterized protein n=1 Tax=Acidaminobacter hydrogenoformans DSM 2784 TaxID=1120920 RepID=A0A1G5S6W8_9FIRM|nr:hypothetical protein [Acidaminobacter hydrogenoformans]SCZ81461.1 hypothetical protein SAMN03080599_02795 [Acidaminobacter hydrogenoformans DSM 2784]